MNFRGNRRQDVDVNLTPLIDVVFLLLIFFMVSTTFVKESEVELTLPQASAELRDQPVDRIDIAIDQNNQVFINGSALINRQLDTIKQGLLDSRPEDGSEPVVIISADESATHQAVISVMDAARQVGLYRITFPTRLLEEE